MQYRMKSKKCQKSQVMYYHPNRSASIVYQSTNLDNVQDMGRYVGDVGSLIISMQYKAAN